MKPSSLFFLISEAGRSVRRNGMMSLAALSTVTVAMSVLGGAVFSLYRLHQFAEAQPRQFEIEVFMRHDADRAAADETKSKIEAMPEIERVTLYTKEQAWRENNPLYGDLKDALDENPLSDCLQVRVKDARETARMSSLFGNSGQFPQVEAVRDAKDEVDKLFTISRLVRNVGGGAAILLFLATAMVIQNTIRLTVHARRREIRIMQLVGATPAFIRLPMVLEGIFYGVAGAALAAGIVILGAHESSRYASQLGSPLASSMPQSASPFIVVAALVAGGALVGWAGSAISVRRFLRRI